jgi:hypothetical protein
MRASGELWRWRNSPFILDTNTRTHEDRVMLKNVTVTLPAETLRAVRVAAAHDGLSMSKWLGRLVERNVDVDPVATEAARVEGQREAMARFLALPKASFQLTDENGKAPSKEWMNDRESLRRFQRPDLRYGSNEDDPDSPLRSVAEPPSPDWPDRPLPASDN